jgi:WD40 repeat protein
MNRFSVFAISCFLNLWAVSSSPAQSLDKATLAWTLPWDADWVTAVSFIGNNQLAAGNNLGDILVWNLPDKTAGPAPLPTRRLMGHTNVINRLLITPDQKTLISASSDHTISYWDVQNESGEPGVVVLNGRAISEAETKKKKAPPPKEAKVQVQKPSQVLSEHKDWVLGMSLTRDGNTLVTGDDKGEVIVWDRSTGKATRRWKLKGWAWAVAVQPEGKSVLISERIPLVFDSGARSALQIWNAQTGEMKVDLSKDFKERMAAAAFSPDGKYLAVGRGGEAPGLTGKVTLLDPANGKKLKEFSPGHQDGLTDLAFHPDGKHLISAGRDTILKVWRLEDGKHIKDLGTPRGGQFKDWFHAVAISPDGHWIAAGDMAGQVHVWHAP